MADDFLGAGADYRPCNAPLPRYEAEVLLSHFIAVPAAPMLDPLAAGIERRK